MPQVLTDQDFDEHIARGLALRRADLDWLPLRAVADRNVDDHVVLNVALQLGRTLLTHDLRTLYPLALTQAASGVPTPRTVAVPRRFSRRRAIDELEVLLYAGTDADWGIGVLRLPL